MLLWLIMTLIPIVYHRQASKKKEGIGKGQNKRIRFHITEVPLIRENSSGPVTFKILQCIHKLARIIYDALSFVYLTPDPIFTSYNDTLIP
jgi:hypothetical protein